ncbi:PorP/SprF family type IX secretion system membrane protein [Chryseobacterium glaciei]|nr:PorP/SprF family type IX secretion system membrane protein [Chryseobacterium glaciei]
MKTIKYIMIAAGILLMSKTYAQLNPMGSTYFQNQYLANPAMAGIRQGWEVNVGYKVQWTAIEGAPTMQAVTADYGTVGKKIGLGINFYNENAGVILRTGIKGTYVYHLALNDNQSFLDFGISGGTMNEWIDYDKVNGDLGDLSLQQFNARRWYADGDFGIAYRNERLTVQGALPNLKRLLNRDLRRNTVDRALYMAAVSYKFITPNFTIEPKAVYRGVENYKDILDIGGGFTCFENKLMISSIYHSSHSVTAGIGTFYQNQLRILCLYTTDTADLRRYSNGEFEIALQYSLK